MGNDFISLFRGIGATHRHFLQSNETHELLWYPSSFLDLTDLLYVNEKFLEDPLIAPDVFIHTDFFESRHHPDNIFDVMNYSCFSNISMKNGLFLNYNCNFYSFHHFEKPKLLIQITGIDNSVFLAHAANTKIKIDYFYTFCDGITTGMGSGGYPISTCYFGMYYRHFNTKYHLTEYRNEFVLANVNNPQVLEGYFTDYPWMREIAAEYLHCVVDKEEVLVNSFRHGDRCTQVYLRSCI